MCRGLRLREDPPPQSVKDEDRERMKNRYNMWLLKFTLINPLYLPASFTVSYHMQNLTKVILWMPSMFYLNFIKTD